MSTPITTPITTTTTTTQEAPKPYQSPSERAKSDPDGLAKALAEAGIKMEAEPKPDAPAPAKDNPGEGSPPDDGGAKAPEKKEESLPTLLRLAKDKDTQRKLMEQKEIEAAKPYVEALKVIPPHTASAIARAIAARDPNGLLMAAGLGAPVSGTTEVKPTEAAPENDISTLKSEIDALRRERDLERAQQTRAQTLGLMKETLKNNPKFQTINGLNDYEGVENILVKYHTQHGALPGDTFQESVELAAELYEYELRQQAERFRPYLTGSSQPAVIEEKKPPESVSTGNVTTRTLTNSNTSAPAAARPPPKTRQEIIEALKSGLELE